MKNRKSRVKKPIYTVRNALRPQFKSSREGPYQSKFYEENYIVIWVVIIFIIIPLLIFIGGFAREKINARQLPTTAIASQQFDQLKLKYPQGYKILEISRGKIVPLVAGTLPNTFQVNWPNAQVKILSDENLIKVVLPDVYYEPGNFNFVTLGATFPRRTGETFSIHKSITHELTIEILEDSGEKILCALAIRDNKENY